MGALDRAERRGRINWEAYVTARKRLLLETRRMTRLGLAIPAPIRMRTLIDAWKLVEKHHIYEADALQIATARQLKATKFLTGDRHLHETASKEGLNSIIPG